MSRDKLLQLAPRWPARILAVGILSLSLLVGGLERGVTHATVETSSPAMKQEFMLPLPVDHIFPTASDAVVAVAGGDSKIMVIGTAMGEVRVSRPFEDEVLSFVPFDTGIDTFDPRTRNVGTTGFVILSRSKTTSGANPHILSIFFIRYRGFKLEETFRTPLPINLQQPAMNFNFQSSSSFLVTWNRTLDSTQSAFYYTTLDSPSDSNDWNVRTPKLYPYELLDIGYGQFMLALYPRNNAISILDVRRGVANDMITVEGLSFVDRSQFAVFVPGAVSDRTRSVIIANSYSALLTVLPVLNTSLPIISSPLQISLKGQILAEIRREKRQLLVTADRDLSFILVGAVGSNQLAVFRKIGGGLEEVEPIVLDKPIRDMIVVHGPENTYPEVFVFLNDNGREITVVREINKLGKAKPANAGSTTTSLPLRVPSLNPGDITQLQRALALLGYQVSAIDGAPGPRTESAIRAFQLDKKLKVSGTVDAPTFAALNDALGNLDKYVVLYGDQNYKGRSQVFTTDNPDFKATTIDNDNASSIKVSPDCSATLYEHQNYKGRSQVFTMDNSNLSNTTIGKKEASSIKVSPGCSATLYEHQNYKGRSQVFTTDNPDFKATTIDNDNASSIKVSPGCSATLYEHQNYKGRSQVFTMDNSNLSNTTIGKNKASSIKVSCQ